MLATTPGGSHGLDPPAGGAGPREAPPRRRGAPQRRRSAPHRLAIVVLFVGAVVTGLLTAASRANYLHNEQRLTTLQTQLTAAAIAVAPEDLERRLGEAVALAAEAKDPAATFRRSIDSSMSSAAGPFVTASLIQVVGGEPRLLVHIGAKSLRSVDSPGSKALVDQAARTTSLLTTRVVGRDVQRFGYLMSASGPAGTFVASAGQALPGDRRVTVPSGSPDAGLEVAIYFGKSTSSSALIETNAAHLPLSGTVSTAEVPFGDTELTLVIAPRGPLAGSWSEFIPWGILVVGVVFTLAIAAMTERLTRRRELAEVLASENRQLFQVQRNVAETLQRSLLPGSLPKRPELAVGVRYLPGTSGIEVGGDWYDVVEVDAGHVLFTIGDVAGRGLEAAALMSMLRNAIKAFASQGDDPGVVLTRLARMVDIGRDGRFATVLCGRIDTATGEMVLANAGHLRPLLVEDGAGEFVSTELGPPIGVSRGPYASVRLNLSGRSTLLAFTDGLIERRGEALSAGMERLRLAATQPQGSLDELLDAVLASLVPGGAVDDVAILALAWQGEARELGEPVRGRSEEGAA
jgi:serine phosphatase RsbU (regulator of sigma subunit)